MGDFFCILLSSLSDRLPGGEYTAESFSKMNKSMNILETPKLLLMVSIRTRRSGLMKKPETKNVLTLSLQRDSVTRFFIPCFFFIKQLLLVPMGMPRNNFEFV
jgi:hypothetical protein